MVGKRSLSSILERNRRVELDKAWETSALRRGAIAALTYLTVLAFLLLIDAPAPFLTALVPVVGFVLSTLTLGGLKQMWISGRKTG